MGSGTRFKSLDAASLMLTKSWPAATTAIPDRQVPCTTERAPRDSQSQRCRRPLSRAGRGRAYPELDAAEHGSLDQLYWPGLEWLIAPPRDERAAGHRWTRPA